MGETDFNFLLICYTCFPVAQRLKRLPAMQETWLQSLGQEDPWRKKWQPTPVFSPGKSHGWRSLVGYGPGACKELDTTERLHFHFLLLCIGEGNGKPLQCSCLENPRDRGAWWAGVHGIAKSRTRLSTHTRCFINFLAFIF